MGELGEPSAQDCVEKKDGGAGYLFLFGSLEAIIIRSILIAIMIFVMLLASHLQGRVFKSRPGQTKT